MPLNNHMPSLMPVVITEEVWQSAVAFPDDTDQEPERLSNLLLAVLLTLRTAGTTRELIPFTVYCLPPRGDMKVPVTLPLSLTRTCHHFLVSMAPRT